MENKKLIAHSHSHSEPIEDLLREKGAFVEQLTPAMKATQDHERRQSLSMRGDTIRLEGMNRHQRRFLTRKMKQHARQNSAD